MKKLLILVVGVLLLVGCSTGGKDTAKETKINIYSRDSSSGTRGAFHEIVGIGEDLTNDHAETSGNGDMATKVGNDTAGVGYVSLTTDLKANKLKALKYEGVEATQENTLNGSYKLARPFNYVTRAAGNFESDAKEQLVAAFVDFLANSKEGRQVVSAAGGITDPSSAKSWNELKVNHPIVDQDNSGITIKTGGSTSVEKTIKAALEAFQPLAGNFKFVMNQKGSGESYKETLGSEKDGASQADIGFASRGFKTEEKVTDGKLSGTYAQDAIAVVVSESNTLESVSQAQVKDIFTGVTKNWEELSK